MIKASWETDYDWRNDKCYKCVMHKDCDAPILFNPAENKYMCIGCGEEAELTDDMKKWIDARSGEKCEIEKCMFCGCNTMKVYYHRNHNTTKWETGHGECSTCGTKFIV